MQTKTKAAPKTEYGPGIPRIGPILGTLLKSMSPLAASAGHFAAARPEVLKGLREVVDGRITQSPPAGPITSAVLDRFGLLGACAGERRLGVFIPVSGALGDLTEQRVFRRDWITGLA